MIYGLSTMKPLAALQDIALFIDVADHLSFSAASRALNIPVATLSRRIAALEKQFGVQLLKRTTRRVELTAAGRLYHERSAQVVRDARSAHDALFESVNEAKGLVRLSMPVDLGVNVVAPLLSAFARVHPDITFDVDLSPHPPASAALVDLSLHLGPVAGDEQAVVRRIASLEMQLFASRDYLQAHGTPAQPADLTLHDCIVHRSASRPAYLQLQRGRSSVSVPVQGRFRANSQGLVRSLVMEGMGIGVVSPSFVPADKLAQFVRVLPQWSLTRLTVYAVMPSRLAPKRVRLLLDYLVEQMGG